MMVWIRSTMGLLMLIVLPTLLLGASELWRLWRPRGAHEPGAASAFVVPGARTARSSPSLGAAGMRGTGTTEGRR